MRESGSWTGWQKGPVARNRRTCHVLNCKPGVSYLNTLFPNVAPRVLIFGGLPCAKDLQPQDSECARSFLQNKKHMFGVE